MSPPRDAPDEIRSRDIAAWRRSASRVVHALLRTRIGKLCNSLWPFAKAAYNLEAY